MPSARAVYECAGHARAYACRCCDYVEKAVTGIVSALKHSTDKVATDACQCRRRATKLQSHIVNPRRKTITQPKIQNQDSKPMNRRPALQVRALPRGPKACRTTSLVCFARRRSVALGSGWPTRRRTLADDPPQPWSSMSSLGQGNPDLSTTKPRVKVYRFFKPCSHPPASLSGRIQ